MKPLKLYFAAVLALLLTVSCKEDDDLQIITAEATLYWSGNYAVDGCGYKLQVNEKKYKPENEDDIPDKFQQNTPMQVKVKFAELSKPVEYTCGFSSTPIKLPGIKILSIEEL
ncbi:hypothetical protein [Pontibacter vulgaris]|uniref:hypothetical protein n=1 Tax=Pontibacter vulgaris TaxID=2905679 RepID=UPI001FA810ED|nr:hypothetical protein [Pontibacter vulgaris]